MNKWIIRLLAGVAAVQVGAAGNAIAHQNGGVAPDEDAWERTVSLNTLEAYAKFSMDFPESRHARQARSKLTALEASDEEVEAEPVESEPEKSVTPEFVPSSIMVV